MKSRLLLQTLAVVLLALAGPAAWAKTIYVAQDGFTEPPCGTKQRPCRQPGLAVEQLEPFDRIVIGPGVYVERAPLQIEHRGVAIVAQDPEMKPVIVRPGSAAGPVIEINADRVTLDGIKVPRANGAPSIRAVGNVIRIRNVTVDADCAPESGPSDGVVLFSDFGSVVENNVLTVGGGVGCADDSVQTGIFVGSISDRQRAIRVAANEVFGYTIGIWMRNLGQAHGNRTADNVVREAIIGMAIDNLLADDAGEVQPSSRTSGDRHTGNRISRGAAFADDLGGGIGLGVFGGRPNLSQNRVSFDFGSDDDGMPAHARGMVLDQTKNAKVIDNTFFNSTQDELRRIDSSVYWLALNNSDNALVRGNSFIGGSGVELDEDSNGARILFNDFRESCAIGLQTARELEPGAVYGAASLAGVLGFVARNNYHGTDGLQEDCDPETIETLVPEDSDPLDVEMVLDALRAHYQPTEQPNC